MRYYNIKPQVVGHLGDGCEVEHAEGRITVRRLHYVFDIWPDDELIATVPCYLVTPKLADLLESAKMSGYGRQRATLTASDFVQEVYPLRTPPVYQWLTINGVPGHDDFGLSEQVNLVISERARSVLETSGACEHASISAWTKMER